MLIFFKQGENLILNLKNRAFPLLLISVINICYADNNLNWFSVNAPPAWIKKGKLKGQGNLDKLSDIIKKEIPEYNHYDLEMNLKRLLILAESGRNVCIIAFNKTPSREMNFHYSKFPVIITSPLKFVILKSLQSNKKVHSINELNDQKLLGHFIDGRSYGPAGNQAIDYLKKSNLKPIAHSDISNRLVKMLIANRVSYILEYPEVINYFTKTTKQKVAFTFLNIPEAKPLFHYAACTKSPQGREVIKKIDNILDSLIQQPNFLAPIKRWLSKEEFQELETLWSQEINSIMK